MSLRTYNLAYLFSKIFIHTDSINVSLPSHLCFIHGVIDKIVEDLIHIILAQLFIMRSHNKFSQHIIHLLEKYFFLR